MCGIIGYLGPKPVVPILLDGLRCLEYRGYDSAGIALAQGRSSSKFAARRASCRNLEEVPINDPMEGTYGIGHTRWATHGRATAENAHPHRDCTGNDVVVHNGIIENYLELKEQLQAEGHSSSPRPIAEIVAHLVEKKSKGGKCAWKKRCGSRSKAARDLRWCCMSARDPRKDRGRSAWPAVGGRASGDGEYLVATEVRRCSSIRARFSFSQMATSRC